MTVYSVRCIALVICLVLSKVALSGTKETLLIDEEVARLRNIFKSRIRSHIKPHLQRISQFNTLQRGHCMSIRKLVLRKQNGRCSSPSPGAPATSCSLRPSLTTAKMTTPLQSLSKKQIPNTSNGVRNEL